LTVEKLDLRGVRCPLNWAKAKVRLEQLAPETPLELLLDDPKGARDIPRAAEASGYVVAEVATLDGRQWRIRIVR
jgi:tRNA 2-thiouridine synthesizing protein A